MKTRSRYGLLFSLWLCGIAAGLDEPSPTDLVNRLESNDLQTRLKAERHLLESKSDAAEALVLATCRTLNPEQNVVQAALRILSTWEKESWTNRQSAAAIDRFIELARDPRNSSGEDVPLGAQARIPFANVVRVLDVTPDAAAAHLSVKPGIKVSDDGKGFYRGVRLGSEWVVEPNDWLYIANLAREIPGTRYTNGRYHPISISVDHGLLNSDTLAECLRYLRKSVNSPIDLDLGRARIDRECLLLLRFYRELTGLTANEWSPDITDEDWAASISAWPRCVSLYLSKSADKIAIQAASKLENLSVLCLNNSDLMEADLQPLRGHKTLSMLLVRKPATDEPVTIPYNPYIVYLNQQGTGKWQIDEAKRELEK